uniref:Putative dna transposase thap9 n=1 Tax=Rhipicephalus microplus TaxID=6941 RepID=A0A6G5AA00_RHIMP
MISKQLFDSTIQYLSLLKEPANMRHLIGTARKTGFLGFIVCMKSLLAMYDFIICKKKILKYIPGHKISQDHLELFFGLIRAHGGHNDHPTAQQFQAAFKKVIVQNELSDAVSGNCQVLDHITILSCSSTRRHSALLLNATVQRRQLLSEECIEQSHVVSEHDYCASLEHISDFGIVCYLHCWLCGSQAGLKADVCPLY